MDRCCPNRTVAISCCFLLCMLISGCQVTSQQLHQAFHRPNARRVELIYRAHADQGAIFQTSAKNEEPVWSMTEMVIHYPHPKCGEKFAEIQVSLKSVNSGGTCERKSLRELRSIRAETLDRWRDAWQARVQSTRKRLIDLPNDPVNTVATMTISKSEFDKLLESLETEGFFSRKTDDGGAAKLEVRVDSHWTSRCWRYEPALDDLISRTLDHTEQQAKDAATAKERKSPISLTAR